MANTETNRRWRVIRHSARGASHERSGLPNQDAADHEDRPAGLILAVADGHGSPRNFRSAEGSRLAVKVALRTCAEFLEGMKSSPLAVVKDATSQQLPKYIEKAWKLAVDQDFEARPFAPAELDRLDSVAGTAMRTVAVHQDNHYLAYGTTLLVVVITESFILYLQLGDGDILVVSDTAAADVSRAIPKDESLIANETTSLCRANAWKDFRFRFQHVGATAPALIVVSTDGYSNAFRSDPDFLKVGADLLDALRTQGPDAVEQALPAWLNEASQSGSGDDITAAVACRLSAITPATTGPGAPRAGIEPVRSGGGERTIPSPSAPVLPVSPPPLPSTEPVGIPPPVPKSVVDDGRDKLKQQ